jgi:hypothetical protein
MSLPLPFWLQAGLLALVVVALHLWRRWRWDPDPPREIVASVVLWVLLFALVSGGRGCAPALHDPADAVPTQDLPPDPFGRG